MVQPATLTTNPYHPAMASTVQKLKAGGWQRVLAWCAGAAFCLWLVSAAFSPARPAAASMPAQEVDAAATGPSAQRLLDPSRDADAAHAAILQRFLQLYGSTPPRVSEIALATGPQQPLVGDDQPDERPENSDDTGPPAERERPDLPVATPYREPDREGIAEGGPADVRAPEGDSPDAIDPNAAAAVLGEEQTGEEAAPFGASLELANLSQINYSAIDPQARQEYAGDTKSVTQGVNGDVSKYDSSAQLWPTQQQQQQGNIESLQSIPRETPAGYGRQSNEVSANVDGRWRDGGTAEDYARSPPQQQTLQERTVLIQPPSRNVYIPEAIMLRHRQEYQPLVTGKNEGPLSHTRAEIQQPISFYSRPPEQFKQNQDYLNSLGVSRNNIVYSKKTTGWGADTYQGTGGDTQRYNAQETPGAQGGGQKLFGRKYLSVSEVGDVHDENIGTVQSKRTDAVEEKAILQTIAHDVQSNQDEKLLVAASSSLTDEDPSKGNSFQAKKQLFNKSDPDNLYKLDKMEEKVQNKNPNDVEERPSLIKQEEIKSIGENVKLEKQPVQYKVVTNVTTLKKESVIQKQTGVIKEESKSTKGKMKCPEGDLVSVQDGGRLGNKLWEYAAVWALPRVLPELNKTAVVPRSLLRALSKLFGNLTLPALEDIPEDCPARRRLESSEPVKRWRLEPLSRAVPSFSGRPLLLHRWIVLAEPVLARLDELRDTEFRLRPELRAGAQQALWALRRRSGVPDRATVTFVGVHVRRTDFSSWLPRVYNRSLADASYFSAGMALCRARARLWRGGRALFAVASDDPDWCEQQLAAGPAGRDVLVSRGGSPEQDLALLAACNQSLADYGTFGQWAALLAGGPAVSLRLDPHVDDHLARLPGWTLA